MTDKMMEQRAEEVVDRIIRDMTDRRGLRQEWDQIDPSIHHEIREVWKNIILAGAAEQVGRDQAVREAFKSGAEWEMTEPALDEKETQGEFLNRGIAAYLATQQEDK